MSGIYPMNVDDLIQNIFNNNFTYANINTYNYFQMDILQTSS